jgi:hypothetical protein
MPPGFHKIRLPARADYLGIRELDPDVWAMWGLCRGYVPGFGAGQAPGSMVTGREPVIAQKRKGKMIRTYKPARIVRNAMLSAAVAGAGVAGLLGATAGAAHASTAEPHGIVTVASCGAMAGDISYSPGLLKTTAQATTATLKGYVANCSNGVNGFGKVTIQMSGTASLASESFGSGTFTIELPGATEASTGTLGVTDNGGTEQLSGTVASGPFTGAVIGVHYQITSSKGKGTTAKPVTSQTFINTTTLTYQASSG